MPTSVKVAPPNSLVLISDAHGGEIPEAMAGSLISSTTSCIAVGCQSDVDGETEFTLGASQQVDPGSQPAFQGRLRTPNGKITVRSVLGKTILEASVPRHETMVRIWVNDSKEPDSVIVGID
jgi:hypothetical protein